MWPAHMMRMMLGRTIALHAAVRVARTWKVLYMFGAIFGCSAHTRTFTLSHGRAWLFLAAGGARAALWPVGRGGPA